MSEDIKQNTEGWSFVISKLEVTSTGGKVFGWFLYFKLIEEKDDQGQIYEHLNTHYITPINQPTTLDIPRSLFEEEYGGDKVIDLEIGPKEIYSKLLTLFNRGYGKIPSPKAEIPMHKIPPSKRDEIMELIRPWETQ